MLGFLPLGLGTYTFCLLCHATPHGRIPWEEHLLPYIQWQGVCFKLLILRGGEGPSSTIYDLHGAPSASLFRHARCASEYIGLQPPWNQDVLGFEYCVLLFCFLLLHLIFNAFQAPCRFLFLLYLFEVRGKDTMLPFARWITEAQKHLVTCPKSQSIKVIITISIITIICNNNNNNYSF